MKFLVVWLSLLSLILSSHSTLASRTNFRDIETRFSRWQDKHGKFYNEDSNEFYKRLGIYAKNAETVQNHNHAHANGLTSFVMTLDTPFADLTDEEFRLSYLMESQNCSATTTATADPGEIKFSSTTEDELPEFVDWRTKGIITPIKDQKACGSCWTFSTTGTLEAHTCLHNPDLDCTTWTGLAEQQLVDCAGDFNNFGCDGGLPSQAFEYIRYAGGIDTEDSYAYHAKDESCKSKSGNVGARVSQVYNISSGDEEDLVRAIALVGPVSVAFDVASDLRFYSHGVYDSFNATTNTTVCKSDPQSVNHAVVAVGYGETEYVSEDTPSVPFYIIRNSWSTSWGMEGYFWMKRGENMCGISDCASFPIVPQGKSKTVETKATLPLRRTTGVASSS